MGLFLAVPLVIWGGGAICNYVCVPHQHCIRAELTPVRRLFRTVTCFERSALCTGNYKLYALDNDIDIEANFYTEFELDVDTSYECNFAKYDFVALT